MGAFVKYVPYFKGMIRSRSRRAYTQQPIHDERDRDTALPPRATASRRTTGRHRTVQERG